MEPSELPPEAGYSGGAFLIVGVPEWLFYRLPVNATSLVRDETLVVTPTAAVMHPSAPGAGEQPPGSRGADCLPVEFGTG